MSFLLYLIGYALVVGGVAFGMHAAGLGQQWVVTAVLILAGIGILGAVRTTGNGTGAPPSQV